MVTIPDIIYLLLLASVFAVSINAVLHIIHAIASLFYKVRKEDKIAYERGVEMLKKEKPKVAIVIPTYNEGDVVKETVTYLLNNITYNNYVIIIADDSTDEYSKKVIDELSKYDRIIVYRRNNREGFKGGCLAEVHNNVIKKLGIKYYYVFDVDWKPEPKFIEKTLPYMLGDEKIGIVQFSRILDVKKATLLQKISSSIIEAAYTVDLPARYILGEWVLFTGSAGLLRTEAIDKAGGWRGHLTEDIDLSVRVTLSGYRIIYIRDVKSYGVETPSSLFAFLKQQFRWASGTIIVGKDYIKKIIFSKLPLRYKISFIYQIMMYLSALFVLSSIILTILYDITIWFIPPDLSIEIVGKLGTVLSLVTILYLISSIIEPLTNIVRYRIKYIPIFPMMILYVWTTIVPYSLAVIRQEKYWIRTPKTSRIARIPLDITSWYIVVTAVVVLLFVIEVIWYGVPIQAYHMLYITSLIFSPIYSILL